MATPDAGASFSIDLAAAPQAIADLKDARDQLQSILLDALQLKSVVPPANDSVSRDAATMLGRAADGGPGSLADALRAGIAQMDQMIATLESELASYQRTEFENTRSFHGLA